MSPVSRGRKGRKNGKKQAGARRRSENGALSSGFDGASSGGPEIEGPEAFDPEVGGLEFDDADMEFDDIVQGADGLELSEIVSGAVATMGELERVDNPIDAEYLTATVLAVGYGGDPDLAEMFARLFVTAAEEAARPGALVFLRCIAALTPEPARTTAAETADRLAAAGVEGPAWLAELDGPVAAGEFVRWPQPDGDGSVLFGSFSRGGRTDGFLMFVDDENCGAAWGLAPFAGVALDDARRLTDDEESEPEEPIAADEFRWLAEAALEARVAHDRLGMAPEVAEDDDAVPHEVTDVVLRSRLAALPVPAKPLPVHVHPEFA